MVSLPLRKEKKGYRVSGLAGPSEKVLRLQM